MQNGDPLGDIVDLGREISGFELAFTGRLQIPAGFITVF